MRALSSLTEKQKEFSSVGLASVILAVMFFIAFFSSRGIWGDPGDSVTIDEVAHIPAGYTYVNDLDFRLNPEHPPLAKVLAGISLVLKGFKGPETEDSWHRFNQWESGWAMLFGVGNDPASVLIWARVPMMLLMILLGAVLYRWSKDLYGRKIGLVILMMYAFYPDVLGHGHLVTTDIAAAFGYVVSIYAFEKVLIDRSPKTLLIAAAALGTAQLLKYSAFLLYGILFLLVFARAYQERRDGFLERLRAYSGSYLWVCLLSVLVVWIVYIPLVWNTPVDIEHRLIEESITQDPRALPFRELLHAMVGNAVLRAAGHYIIGMYLVIAQVVQTNVSFAFGKITEEWMLWYFPFAWLVKTPITIILLTLTTFGLLVTGKYKIASREERWTVTVILVPVFVYWASAIGATLHIGVRHLIPVIPFILLLIGWCIKRLTGDMAHSKRAWTAIAVLVLYMVLDSLSYFPLYIAYFNNFVSRDARYTYLVDSSLDWGQDFLRLKKYIEDEGIAKIKLDYFRGDAQQNYYLRNRHEKWRSSYGPTTGWLAVSATRLQSSKSDGPKNGKWSYEWLSEHTPRAIIGGSILVYHISEQDMVDRPPMSPYRITGMDVPESGTNDYFQKPALKTE